jgi:hypothetical protein
MGRTELLPEIPEMRFEGLLDRHELGDLIQQEAEGMLPSPAGAPGMGCPFRCIRLSLQNTCRESWADRIQFTIVLFFNDKPDRRVAGPFS